MIRVTISTEGMPLVYDLFEHACLADDFAAMWRALAVKAGVLIRIDRGTV